MGILSVVKLVDDWKSSWKWISNWCMGAAGAMQATYMLLPPEMKATIPTDWLGRIMLALMVFGIFGRMVKQGGDDVPPTV